MPFTGAETTSRMYGLPHFDSSTTLVKLDTQTPGFMRAPFEMSSLIALEGAIDELCYKTGRDPVELRTVNDTQTDSITGKPFSSRRLNECLRRGAERFGWERRSHAPASMRDNDGFLEHAMQGVISTDGPEYPDFVAFSYIAHFVEVRVDPRIRRARVARVVSVADCGRVVSRRTARSQIYGGLVWGIGAALSEETEVDPRFGGFLNANIAEYQMPVNADIGSFEVDFIDESDFKLNAVGSKSLGEVASVGAAAGITNAVFLMRPANVCGICQSGSHVGPNNVLRRVPLS
jgi:CO/xanthine dehydrogenase Mo-binding subunit